MHIRIGCENFFPIGLYHGMAHLGFEYSPNAIRFGSDDIEHVRDVFKQTAEAGFNCVRYIPWHGYDAKRDAKVLDVAEEYGLKLWTSAQVCLDRPKWLIEHPALLMWELADEPVWRNLDPSTYIETYKKIKAIDKDHMVWINQAPQDSLLELRKFNDACDVSGIDIYPYYPEEDQGHFVNREISMIGDYMEWMHSAVDYSKPVIMVLQGFYILTNLGTIRPTYEELRFMVYDAIVHQCAGIVFFGTTKTYGGGNWRALFPVLDEVNALQDILVLEDACCNVFPFVLNRADKPIKLCMKRVGNDVYLIAVNRSGERADVRFEGIDWTLGNELTVLFENRKVTVDTEHGTFVDRLRGYEVHIYSTTSKNDKTIDFERRLSSLER